jgi:iron complex outermembrane receptor protein
MSTPVRSELTLNQIGYGGLTDLSGVQPGSDQQLRFSTCRRWFQCDQERGSQHAGLWCRQGRQRPTGTTPSTCSSRTARRMLQLNFGNDDVHGNLGVRFVHTEFTSQRLQHSRHLLRVCRFVRLYLPAGLRLRHPEQHAFNNWLPAFNIAWNVSRRTSSCVVRRRKRWPTRRITRWHRTSKRMTRC